VFDRYIEEYGGRLYALCLRLCRGPWDAQDLYQETWLKAYRAIKSYSDQRSFEAWLTRICVNTYKDQLRHKKLAFFLNLSTNEEQQAILDNLPAPQQADYSEVREAVNTLSEPLRLAVLLYYFHGRSVGQAAEALGIPVGTVKSRLSKARSLLKEVLEE